MQKRLSLALLLLLTLCAAATAQDGSGFSLRGEPAVVFPFPSTPSAQRFTIGYQGAAIGEYVIPALPVLSIAGAIDYANMPFVGGGSLQTVGASAGGGVRLRFLQSMSATAWARGGYSLGMLGAVSDGVPYLHGLDLDLYITPSFRVGLGGEYSHYFALSQALYQGLGARLLVGYNFSQANRKAGVEIKDIRIQQLFPAFYKYYDTNTLGTVTIRNGEDGPVTDVVVSFFVKQYMDAPKECARITQIGRGETKEVPLYALFNPAILAVLEPSKAPAVVTVSYRYVERAQEASSSISASFNHRNAMTWDDNRHVAGFATVNDPAVLGFGKQVAGLVRGSGWQSLDAPLRQAVGIFEGLGLYGIHYVTDPNTPFTEYSKNASAVDYLQFPIQTLQFRAGDCDDLSILTCALLEGVGIETAFITVPGHIYVAFAQNMKQDDARAFFSRPDDLIYRSDRAWVPVEVTAVQEGFLRAWQLGAREWRDGVAGGTAGFWPTHEAWKLYEPVALIGASTQIETPSSEKLLSRFQAAMTAFVDRELQPKEQKLKADISAARKDPRPVNSLGVLYARYGLYDKAEAAFRDALKAGPSKPAWYNLGNIMLLKNDFKSALSAFQSSNGLGAGDPRVLAGLVRASYELDDRDGAARWLAQLSQTDSAMAEQFAYVSTGAPSSTARAGEAAAATLPWEE